MVFFSSYKWAELHVLIIKDAVSLFSQHLLRSFFCRSAKCLPASTGRREQLFDLARPSSGGVARQPLCPPRWRQPRETEVNSRFKSCSQGLKSFGHISREAVRPRRRDLRGQAPGLRHCTRRPFSGWRGGFFRLGNPRRLFFFLHLSLLFFLECFLLTDDSSYVKWEKEEAACCSASLESLQASLCILGCGFQLRLLSSTCSFNCTGWELKNSILAWLHYQWFDPTIDG